MDDSLVIQLDTDDDASAPRVRVRGEIDMSTAPVLRSELDLLLERGAQYITLDFGDVPFIDSAGLAVLVAALMRLRDERDGRIRVEGVQDSVRRIFENTGLGPMFGIAPR